MEFIDKVLTCADCGGEFIFTAGEQIFFFDKAFKNDPKRCKPCKAKRSTPLKPDGAGAVSVHVVARTETRTRCSQCGIDTTVPFKPTQGRPVLCRLCFQSKRPITAVMPDAKPAEIPGVLLAQETGASDSGISSAATSEH